MGVSAAFVGTLMMIARFVDAFTDVTMGQIVDRSKPTAAGKFKPWLLRVCGPVAVASLSTFRTMGGALAGICIGVLLPIIIYDKVGDVQVMTCILCI